MTSEIRFDPRMSDAEALMWRLDKDPYLSSTFGNLSILDRAPDFDRLRRRMERAAVAIPRLRQRVQSSPANITPPVWVEDPDFDIDFHVRRVAVPAPGGVRELLDLCALVVADPFDRTRPLWQFVVFEGLADGRAALLEKLHHTIADGEGSVQLSLQFFDFERDAPEPAPLAPTADSAAESSIPTDLWRDLLAGPMKIPLALVRQIRDLLAHPTEIAANGSSTIDTVRSLLGTLTDVEPARSPLWTERSVRRRMEIVRVPFLSARDTARHLGGTLNTVLLAAASDAAGRYHREFGSPVDELRASMAVSTRKSVAGHDSSANAFSLARMLVPTGAMHPVERFTAVDAICRDAAGSSADVALDAVSALASSMPTAILTRVARLQAQTVDFATSNVKGTPIPVFVAGSEIVANHPFGPLGGVAFNLTLLSHVGQLDMGLHVDHAAVEHPERLRDHLADSFADLVAAGRPSTSSKSASKTTSKTTSKSTSKTTSKTTAKKSTPDGKAKKKIPKSEAPA